MRQEKGQSKDKDGRHQLSRTESTWHKLAQVKWDLQGYIMTKLLNARLKYLVGHSPKLMIFVWE